MADPETPPIPAAPALSPRRSVKKRLFFLLLVFVLLLIAGECGLRIAKKVFRPESASRKAANDCDAIVFATLGDSMTFGLGASKGHSYPLQLPTFFARQFDGIPLNVYNIAVPGSNTSDGLKRARDYAGSLRGRKTDYALILYGVNNRWNLSNATFWEWDAEAKKENYLDYLSSRFQLSKLFTVAVQSRIAGFKKGRTPTKNDYCKMLDRHGWDMFFRSFKDDLLRQWIERDLLDMSRELRDGGIEPIFLTYQYPKFPELNPLLMDIAQKAEAPLFDIEEPFEFYSSRKMFDKDFFHLNDKGYRNLAQRIMEQFKNLHSEEALRERLRMKRARDACAEKTASTPSSS